MRGNHIQKIQNNMAERAHNSRHRHLEKCSTLAHRALLAVPNRQTMAVRVNSSAGDEKNMLLEKTIPRTLDDALPFGSGTWDARNDG